MYFKTQQYLLIKESLAAFRSPQGNARTFLPQTVLGWTTKKFCFVSRHDNDLGRKVLNLTGYSCHNPQKLKDSLSGAARESERDEKKETPKHLTLANVLQTYTVGGHGRLHAALASEPGTPAPPPVGTILRANGQVAGQ